MEAVFFAESLVRVGQTAQRVLALDGRFRIVLILSVISGYIPCTPYI